MTADYPSILYGEADFVRIRRTGALYVDKTRFLRQLERSSYAVLIRPRRFGKSCWVSLLENYYDRRWKDEFDTVFGGTDIGREPTDERHRYVVLRFDFSAVKTALPTLEAAFEDHCRSIVEDAVEGNPDLFPEDAARRILAPPAVNSALDRLFQHASRHDIPLYVLIDEYDNFANTVLAKHGEEAYQSFTHGGGFYRDFFATLKAGAARRGGLERLFITGVSPITLDDVTSGFNIGHNLSLDPRFNEIFGFTEAEVRGLLENYRDRGAFGQDIDEALATMRDWYDGYRFAKNAETSVYNTDMVLYYLRESTPPLSGPDNLIDENVKVDYGKLKHLLMVEQELNGNFDLLRQVAVEERATCELKAGFPLERLTERENFLSLMHYFGLLSIRGVEDGETVLGIPNQTVKRLMYGYLRHGYRAGKVFAADFHRVDGLMRRMVHRGEWRPLFEFLGEQMNAQLSNRDYAHAQGEAVVKALLLGYLGRNRFHEFRSEVELSSPLGKGYADIVLEPMTGRHPHLRWGYLIELKYLKRGEKADEAQVESLARQAREQLRRYLADDRLARQHPQVRFIGLALVFHGWEMVHCEAVERAARQG